MVDGVPEYVPTSFLQIVLSSTLKCLTSFLPSGIVNSYCWLHSTYSVKGASIGDERSGMDGNGPDDAEAGHTYHRFYQWVGFVFVLQVWHQACRTVNLLYNIIFRCAASHVVMLSVSE